MDDKKELAESASELLKNPAFSHAILTLRKIWFAELMTLEPAVGSEGYLTRVARCATLLQALERIPTELQIIVNNYKMDPNRGGRNK